MSLPPAGPMPPSQLPPRQQPPRQQPPRHLHRAIVLVVMITVSVLFLVVTFPAPAMFTGRAGLALGVVVLGAAIGGIAFSWRRYFGKK